MPRKRKKPPPASLVAAHNPKAVGSNPAPATRKISVFDVKVAVFLVFLSDLFLCPLKKFNFNSTSQKIQAFFKNTSARIAGRDACPTQEGGHSPQPGVSALPSPGDLDPDFGLGGTGFDDIAAGAADHRGTILGMDTVFHCFHLFRVPPPGDEDAHPPMAAG